MGSTSATINRIVWLALLVSGEGPMIPIPTLFPTNPHCMGCNGAIVVGDFLDLPQVMQVWRNLAHWR